uniref:LicD family protein n=1 Tax=Macrostomum lignano TaxID=282301 RepID=A0A1I8FWQ7_9PLAT
MQIGPDRFAMLTYLLRRFTPKKIARCVLLTALCIVSAKICLLWLRSPGSCRGYPKAAALNATPAQKLPSVEFYIRLLSTRAPFRTDLFGPQITATELRAILRLLWTFLDLCEQRGLPALLYGNSLLGSYRHHGVVPWDDSVSLLMKGADQGKLADALAGLQAGHVQVSQAGETSGVRLYPLELTLPPHKRPFMGRWVDSPRDALGFLALAAEASASCRSLAYSHQLEAPLAPETIGCEKLAPVYPFAVRAADSAPSCRGVLETLKFPDSEPMYTVAVSEPLDALNADYSTLRLR